MLLTIAATFGCFPFRVIPLGTNAWKRASSFGSTFVVHCLTSASSGTGIPPRPVWQSTQPFGYGSLSLMPGILRAAANAGPARIEVTARSRKQRFRILHLAWLRYRFTVRGGAQCGQTRRCDGEFRRRPRVSYAATSRVGTD